MGIWRVLGLSLALIKRSIRAAMHWSHQSSSAWRLLISIWENMEPINHTVRVPDSVYPRRPMHVVPRGASSHFVGSTIVILSSYAVATLAMNCGKKIQEERLKPSENWCRVPHQELLLFDTDVHLGETFFNKTMCRTFQSSRTRVDKSMKVCCDAFLYDSAESRSQAQRNRPLSLHRLSYESTRGWDSGTNEPKWGLWGQILQFFLLKCFLKPLVITCLYLFHFNSGAEKYADSFVKNQVWFVHVNVLNSLKCFNTLC